MHEHVVCLNLGCKDELVALKTKDWVILLASGPSHTTSGFTYFMSRLTLVNFDRQNQNSMRLTAHRELKSPKH